MASASTGAASVPVQPRSFPGGVEIKYLSSHMVKVTLDAVVTRTRSVFVQTRGEPAQGFMVIGSQVRPTEVTVSGPSTEVRKVGRVLAPVDVSGRNDTASVPVELMPLDVGGLPVGGVKVEPNQATVTVQMRQVNSRTVPVAPVIGKVPEGYEVAAVTVRPVVVNITGPASGLAAIAAVQTAPLDLTNVPGKTQYVVPLQTPAGVTVLGTPSARITVTLRKTGSGESTPAAAPEPPGPPPDGPVAAPPARPEAPAPAPATSGSTSAPKTPAAAPKTTTPTPKPPGSGSKTPPPAPVQP